MTALLGSVGVAMAAAIRGASGPISLMVFLVTFAVTVVVWRAVIIARQSPEFLRSQLASLAGGLCEILIENGYALVPETDESASPVMGWQRESHTDPIIVKAFKDGRFRSKLNEIKRPLGRYDMLNIYPPFESIHHKTALSGLLYGPIENDDDIRAIVEGLRCAVGHLNAQYHINVSEPKD